MSGTPVPLVVAAAAALLSAVFYAHRATVDIDLSPPVRRARFLPTALMLFAALGLISGISLGKRP